MIFRGGFEMKTSRTLISSAMLTAMCDTNSIDNLKLRTFENATFQLR